MNSVFHASARLRSLAISHVINSAPFRLYISDLICAAHGIVLGWWVGFKNTSRRGRGESLYRET